MVVYYTDPMNEYMLMQNSQAQQLLLQQMMNRNNDGGSSGGYDLGDLLRVGLACHTLCIINLSSE